MTQITPYCDLMISTQRDAESAERGRPLRITMETIGSRSALVIQLREIPMPRAARCYSAEGVAMTARTIMRFMIECQMDYLVAAGQCMITRDEIWYQSEHKAFREAFEELYGKIHSYEEAKALQAHA